MLQVSNYCAAKQLGEDNVWRIYQGCREKDRQSVILKVLRFPLKDVNKIREKNEGLINTSLEGIISIEAVEIDEEENFLIIEEDFGGKPLQEILKIRRLGTRDLLFLMTQVSKILNHLHQQDILYKNLTPSKILWNEEQEKVKLVDPRIILGETGQQGPYQSNVLDREEWIYISPEQTGRMSRSVDSRSDLYALGIILYEILTGEVPFFSTDPMELAHFHIAKQVTPPREFDSRIPPLLSEISMKLLAKTSEARYQSAAGLYADFQCCLGQFEFIGAIVDFDIAKHDVSERPQIPKKLYGREQEIEALLRQFEDVSQGNVSMTLVEGYSGVGKSTLIYEIHEFIALKQGFFISGKFDQIQRNTPYSALIQAFQGLVEQLLTQPPEQLLIWETKLINALGSNGQVIVDVIPTIELIIGPQAPIPQLQGPNGQVRFHQTFKNLIQVFAKKEHPLVLFLDDLQWIDQVTLFLLKEVMLAPGNQGLLFIGAYRSQDLGGNQPFTEMLSIFEQKSWFHRIFLTSLKSHDLRLLLEETLKVTTKPIQELSSLVMEKTGGNPFFVNEFLKNLYEEGLLAFDVNQLAWCWDIREIQAQKITDNVVELLIQQLQKFPEETQRALRLGACFGNVFDLQFLSIICKRSLFQIAQDLWPAVEMGVLIPRGHGHRDLREIGKFAENEGVFDSQEIYDRFAHDRLRQAAYALIKKEQQEKVHLKIGRLLLNHLSEHDIQEQIFEVVSQLNEGRGFIEQEEEKFELAALNLKSALQSIKSNVYQSALKYLSIGLELLPEKAWQIDYSLIYQLSLKYAECCYWNQDRTQAQVCLDQLLKRVKTDLEKINLLKLKSVIYIHMSDLEQAKDSILEALSLFEVPLCQTTEEYEIKLQEESKTLIRSLTIEGIENLSKLPLLKDIQTQSLVDLMVRAHAPLFQNKYINIAKLLIVRAVKISLDEGNGEASALAYIHLASYIGEMNQNYQLAFRIGQSALVLSSQAEDPSIRVRVIFLYALQLNHFGNSLESSIDLYQHIYTDALNIGDLLYAGYCVGNISVTSFLSGTSLENWKSVFEEQYTLGKQVNYPYNEVFFSFYHQVLLALEGKTNRLSSLDCGNFVESEHFKLIKKENEVLYIWLMPTKFMLLVMDQEYAEILDYVERTQSVMVFMPTSLYVTAYYFYYTLALIIQNRDHVGFDYGPEIDNQCKRIECWSEACPINYRHLLLHIQAENAISQGRDMEAFRLYEQAIALAKENQFFHHVALINEFAVRLAVSHQFPKIAELYLKEALHFYQVWGATRKVQDLKVEFHEIFQNLSHEKREIEIKASREVEKSKAQSLDLSSLIKISQTLSSEIQLDRLLESLMKIVMENAGAEKGYLLMEEKGALQVKVKGTTEQISFLESVTIESLMPVSIIAYVSRMETPLILDDATQELHFAMDFYIQENHPKSILCLPLLHHGELIAIFYLENNLVTGAFTNEGLEVLKILSTQAAISIANAKMYKQQEKALALEKKAKEELKQANQLKDEFLANTSHELQTPLHGIMGLAESLLYDGEKNLLSSQIQDLRLITKSSRRLSGLVSNLLDFSKMKNQDLELNCKPVGVKSTIELVMAFSESFLKEKEVEMIFLVPENLPFVNADENRLEQILLNLIGNAIKFTEKGQIVISAKQEKEEVHIFIQDTGIGIQLEKQEEIFKPFIQEDGTIARGYGGTGLGLSISKQLVELHGGEIKVESTKGEGATFSFSLPISKRGEQIEQEPLDLTPDSLFVLREKEDSALELEGRLPLEEGENENTERGRILIIDDEPINVKLLKNQLTLHRYQVLTAENGPQALEIIEKQTPDLVLLDLMMPRMNGYEVCQKIRKNHPPSTLPIVMLTAKNQVESLVQGFQYGANDYLTKPFQGKELLARVENHLALKNAILALKNAERAKIELQTASTLQELLIPKQDPHLEEVELASFYQSSSETGGDWYSYQHHPEYDTLGVLIGDVTGHGVPAALITAMVNSFYASLEEYRFFQLKNQKEEKHLLDPSYLLFLLNNMLYRSTEGLYQMSFFHSVFDLKARQLRYTSSAHEPCYLWRPSKHVFIRNEQAHERSVVSLGERSFRLGYTLNSEYPVRTQELKKGDVLLWFTDGLIEERNVQGKPFGSRKLKLLLQSSGNETAEEIKNRILKAFFSHIGTKSLEDDVTLIVGRVR